MKILLFLSLLVSNFAGIKAMQQSVAQAKLREFRGEQTVLIKALLDEYASKFRDLKKTYPTEDVYDDFAVTRYSHKLHELAQKYKTDITSINPNFLDNVCDLTPQIRSMATEGERRESFLKLLKSYRESMLRIHEAKAENIPDYERRFLLPRIRSELSAMRMASGIKIEMDLAHMTNEQLQVLADSYYF